MKICIFTLHRVFNYGSILQTYATQEVFKQLGYEVEVVDYITKQRTNKRLYLSVPSFVKPDFIHKYGYILSRAASILIKKKVFGGFLHKYVHLSKRKYISAEDLKITPPIADLYVAGSDQIWNSQYNEGIDEGFFLTFVSDTPKISFASSFGKTCLENWEIEKTKNYLSKFKALSVREKSAVELIKQFGMKATCIIDPTLQLGRQQWIKLASKRLVKEKYIILMLLYNEDNGATEYARKLADQKEMKLVKLSWEIKKPKQVDLLMTHRSPEDFLSLFYFAEFVVTNSFHGLAFSINLNKEFVIFPRNEFNSRIENLLEITGLSDRMIRNNNGLFEMRQIDYAKVNQVLDKERDLAKEFLHEALNK